MSLPNKVDFLKNLIPDPCISSALRKPRIVDNLPPSNKILIECESEPKPNQQEQKPSTPQGLSAFYQRKEPKKGHITSRKQDLRSCRFPYEQKSPPRLS